MAPACSMAAAVVELDEGKGCSDGGQPLVPHRSWLAPVSTEKGAPMSGSGRSGGGISIAAGGCAGSGSYSAGSGVGDTSTWQRCSDPEGSTTV